MKGHFARPATTPVFLNFILYCYSHNHNVSSLWRLAHVLVPTLSLIQTEILRTVWGASHVCSILTGNYWAVLPTFSSCLAACPRGRYVTWFLPACWCHPRGNGSFLVPTTMPTL